MLAQKMPPRPQLRLIDFQREAEESLRLRHLPVPHGLADAALACGPVGQLSCGATRRIGTVRAARDELRHPAGCVRGARLHLAGGATTLSTTLSETYPQTIRTLGLALALPSGGMVGRDQDRGLRGGWCARGGPRPSRHAPSPPGAAAAPPGAPAAPSCACCRVASSSAVSRCPPASSSISASGESAIELQDEDEGDHQLKEEGGERART